MNKHLTWPFILGLLISTVETSSKASVEQFDLCDPSELSDSINPNSFSTELTFSPKKLYGTKWYEHYYYTTPQTQSIVTSLTMKITPNKETLSHGLHERSASVQVSAFQAGSCINWQATWNYNEKKPLSPRNIKQDSRNNKVSSVWLLDAKGEEFMLLAICDGIYNTKWNGAHECSQWGFALMFNDTKLRSDDEIAEIEGKLEFSICYPVLRLWREQTLKANYGECKLNVPEDSGDIKTIHIANDPGISSNSIEINSESKNIETNNVDPFGIPTSAAGREMANIFFLIIISLKSFSFLLPSLS